MNDLHPLFTFVSNNLYIRLLKDKFPVNNLIKLLTITLLIWFTTTLDVDLECISFCLKCTSLLTLISLGLRQTQSSTTCIILPSSVETGKQMWSFIATTAVGQNKNNLVLCYCA